MNPIIYKLWVPDGMGNHPARQLSSIDYITIHTTGNRNPTATAEAHARFQYTGGGGRQASWHYTVDEHEIWQSFHDEQMCWHTGTLLGNETSIGIEICVNSREGFVDACKRGANLTAFLLKLYGSVPIVQHHFWSGKNCPSELRSNVWGVSWDDFIKMVEGALEYDIREEERHIDAEAVLGSLRDADIRFDEDHWRRVLNGEIRPNRDWTKILTNRIIEHRWEHFTPQVLGTTFEAMIGKRFM